MASKTKKDISGNSAVLSASDIDGRKNMGVKIGFFMLALNLALGAAKLVAGLLYGSLSVTSDAANNLSDAGNNIVVILSFILAGRKADKDHPHGHGRYEYIASLIIALVIIMLGAEFLISGIRRAVNPTLPVFDILIVAVLVASITIKAVMAAVSGIFSKKQNSPVLKAVLFDSLADILISSTVLASLIIAQYVSVAVMDAVAGIAVACFIIFSGLKILKGTVDKLLGRRADADLIRRIYEIVNDAELVAGAHDLEIHEYGPNRLFATIHAEFDKNIDIKTAHGIIDALEKTVAEQTGVSLVIHCDPVGGENKQIAALRQKISEVLCRYDGCSAHEISFTQSEVVFDISLPEKYEKQKDYLADELRGALSSITELPVVITFDIIF